MYEKSGLVLRKAGIGLQNCRIKRFCVLGLLFLKQRLALGCLRNIVLSVLMLLQQSILLISAAISTPLGQKYATVMEH